MPWIPLAPALGILGLLMAFGIYRYVVAQPAGSGLMVEISDSIQTGAMASSGRSTRSWPGSSWSWPSS